MFSNRNGFQISLMIGLCVSICLSFIYHEIRPDHLIDEICDNAIDDDLDGLIDLNDPDCDCQIIEPVSLIPNPSFEDYTCCPNSVSGESK